MVTSAAELDQRDAEVAFLGGKAGVAGGERRGDDPLDLEMRVLDRLAQVAHRRPVGEHRVDIDPEPLGVEALGIGDAFRPVEEIARRLGVEHHPPVGLERVAPGGEQLLDVLLLDPAPADLDLDLADPAGEPRARSAEPDALHGDPGELFRPFERVAHGIGRGGHVGHVAALDPLRGAVAGTEHGHLAVLRQPGDHRRDAEAADVHRAENPRDTRLGGHQVVPPSTKGGLFSAAHCGQRM